MGGILGEEREERIGKGREEDWERKGIEEERGKEQKRRWERKE